MELNKTILLIGILFLILPNISAVIINEIMYDPQGADSGREWIEIYNNEPNSINLTDWKFVTDNSNHGLNAPPQNGGQGSLIISPNEYIILAQDAFKFLEDYPGYTGTIIDSSWTDLTNSIEHTLKLKDSNQTIINESTYNPNLGANNNGNSLQICSSWTEKSPTPGSINPCGGNNNNNNNNNNYSNSSNNNSEEQKNESTATTIEVNYPPKVNLNQEFIFKIKLINFDQDNYDVKIEILLNGARIANIMNNNQWKSTIYYLMDIIKPNEEKEFTMRITEEFENADITIKIKDSNEKIETFQGYKISKLNNEGFNQTYNGTASEIIYLNASLTNKQNENNEINILTENTNSKDIKSEENKIKLDKNKYARYILTAFVFLLALLFLLKKIFKKKYQNEFKN